MVERNKYDDMLNEIKKVADAHSLTCYSEKLNEIANELARFDIKVLVVGHFSAGKSALLNLIIDNGELLTEDLYKNPDTGSENRRNDYYWLNNDHLENIDGDYHEIESFDRYQIISYGNTYVKVKPSECDSIDFSDI